MNGILTLVLVKIVIYMLAKNVYLAMLLSLQTAGIMNPSTENIVLPSSDYLTNNHRPRFDNKTTLKSYWLPEDLPTGSIVGHLSASDEDSGFAGLIQYKISQGNSKGRDHTLPYRWMLIYLSEKLVVFYIISSCENVLF